MKFRIVIWCMVCIHLIAGAQAISGAVLCLGADGHRDVEVAVNGKCSPSFAPDGTPGSPDAFAASDGRGSCQETCLDCIDIPLTSDPATVSSSPSFDVQKLASMCVASSGEMAGVSSPVAADRPDAMRALSVPPGFTLLAVQLLI